MSFPPSPRINVWKFHPRSLVWWSIVVAFRLLFLPKSVCDPVIMNSLSSKNFPQMHNILFCLNWGLRKKPYLFISHDAWEKNLKSIRIVIEIPRRNNFKKFRFRKKMWTIATWCTKYSRRMHIGINFLVARLSDLRVRTLFYFPLDKYYDRAAKKSCQDLNCKNCLEVTHFGM